MQSSACHCLPAHRDDEVLLTNFISRQNNFSFSIYVYEGNFHTPVTHPLGDASAYR